MIVIFIMIIALLFIGNGIIKCSRSNSAVEAFVLLALFVILLIKLNEFILIEFDLCETKDIEVSCCYDIEYTRSGSTCLEYGICYQEVCIN